MVPRKYSSVAQTLTLTRGPPSRTQNGPETGHKQRGWLRRFFLQQARNFSKNSERGPQFRSIADQAYSQLFSMHVCDGKLPLLKDPCLSPL